MEYEKLSLTKTQSLLIAEWLSEDRLEKINVMCQEVHVRDTFYTRYVKRTIDILISLIALIVTVPVNLIIGTITFFDVGRPIFFKQERVGRNGKPFTIIKFRNMTNATDENGELLPDSQRVTKFGEIVRKTSLDELLNFLSILKGEQSILGPRPLLPEYTYRYNKRHKMRLAIRPGLECPPRARLDHAWSWQEQFENDIWYVENVSFLTDCMMLVRLIQFAFDRKSAAARATARRGAFMGYNENGIAINMEGIPKMYIDKVVEFETLKNMENPKTNNSGHNLKMTGSIFIGIPVVCLKETSTVDVSLKI